MGQVGGVEVGGGDCVVLGGQGRGVGLDVRGVLFVVGAGVQGVRGEERHADVLVG